MKRKNTYVLSNGHQYVGLDGVVTDKNDLYEIIIKLLKFKKPRVLIFEAYVYGVTYMFAKRLSVFAKALGYEYVAVCLTCENEILLKRLHKRNGGKKINVLSKIQTNKAALSAAKKLKESNIKTLIVDTGKIEKEKMYKIIEGLV